MNRNASGGNVRAHAGGPGVVVSDFEKAVGKDKARGEDLDNNTVNTEKGNTGGRIGRAGRNSKRPPTKKGSINNNNKPS